MRYTTTPVIIQNHCLAMEKYQHVYVNDDLTTSRSKLEKILNGEKEIKSVCTIEGRINCTVDRDGHEVRKVIESLPMICSSSAGRRPRLLGWDYSLTCKTEHFPG